MKLAALCTVAAFSLIGCADEAAIGGGQGEGIFPSKISLANPNEPRPFDARDVVNVLQKLNSAPADAICDGCVMTSFRLVDNSYGIDEVRFIHDGDTQVCQLFLSHGTVVTDECGWSHL